MEDLDRPGTQHNNGRDAIKTASSFHQIRRDFESKQTLGSVKIKYYIGIGNQSQNIFFKKVFFLVFELSF